MNELFHVLAVIFQLALYAFVATALLDGPKEVK